MNRFGQRAHAGTALTAVLVVTKSSHYEFKEKVHIVKHCSPIHCEVAEVLTQEGHTKTPRGRSALEPILNLARPSDAMRENHNGSLCSHDINTEKACVGAQALAS